MISRGAHRRCRLSAEATTKRRTASAGGRHRLSLRALRVLHPFPTALNALGVAALLLVAQGADLDSTLLAVMVATMLLIQSAIGVVNDYCDRGLDAATKPWKPIPAGLVRPTTALVAGVMLAAGALALAATLGVGGFLLALLGLSAGLAYDVRLKRTRLAALPYMVAIPTLPLWVWVTAGEWEPALWWIVPIGALVGLALHLANTLPDIAGDETHGVAGFAHLLGPERSRWLAWSTFAVALAIATLSAPLAGAFGWVYGAGAIIALLTFVATVALYRLRRDAWSLQFGFGAFGVGAVALSVGWLAGLG